MSEIKKYERFKELYKEKKYALAYAMSNKFPKLQETTEFKKMEKNFQTSFNNAQKLILLDLPHKAKDQINKYITVLSKRDILQLVINNTPSFKDFLFAYQNNDFKTCYEIMDNNKPIGLIKISILLNQHWARLIEQCELYAKDGNISSIKSTLGDLILTNTRADEIASLLKISFYMRIKQLLNKENYIGAESIIYSYIDIFGIDKEIKKWMLRLEKSSSLVLAITHQKQKISKTRWMDSEIIRSSDS